jgi:hypothetical protein
VLEWLEPVRVLVMSILDLFDLRVDDKGVFLDANVPLPTVQFGVIGVSDVIAGFQLDLPNTGPSAVGFNLSTRQDPFTIALFGAGGSGSLELRTEATELVFLQGSLAVTYELAASFIVVSASLSASLGVDVLYEHDEVTLGAFVELRGNASLLGVVNITGKVLLALRYNLTTKVLSGTAQVTAEVDSLFGKSDVSYDAEVDVALGSGGANIAAGRLALAAPSGSFEPTSFRDRFTKDVKTGIDEWSDYCSAYS